MIYNGEHIWAGELGRISIIISAFAALLSAWAYFMAERKSDLSWHKLGRNAFYLHALGTFTIVGTLLFMILNHYFEYEYVWKHSSNALPLKYILSSFWEGQEGSFLLWMFWHSVLGLILMHTAKKWEASTMISIALVQGFLATMLFGIYIGDMKIGSSPFVLIRELPENIGLPWTMIADYLQRIPAFADGRGLNPLLQNYWMTIHPPTLFLGFASTIIPFAFAMAGLVKNDFRGWIKPALPWAFFSVMILGTGILMGGAWAYEALSFGGFWAWDPVENASLVPWLTMVAAAHLILLDKNRKGANRSATFMTIITFILILYSTFLTRSGVLGDASVHAFVDLGLSGQLLIYLLFFGVLSIGIFLFKYRKMPHLSEDEPFLSREFWMFIGSLVLMISGLQITSTTSVPVWNHLVGPEGIIPLLSHKIAPPNDAISHYNSMQIPFAIIVSLLVGFGQFLTYKKTDSKTFWKNFFISFGISTVLSVIWAYFLKFDNPLFVALLITGNFAIIGNIYYFAKIAKRQIFAFGPSLAHVGFGFILIGALISNGKKEFISTNTSFIHENFPQNKNILIETGDTVEMADYEVRWLGQRFEKPDYLYDLEFTRKDNLGNVTESFVLSPIIKINEMMGNSPEPSTKHYLTRDIYTHITYADQRSDAEKEEEWQNEIEFGIAQGEEHIIYDNWMLRFDTLQIFNMDMTPDKKNLSFLRLGANLVVTTMDGSQHMATPIYVLNNGVEGFEDAIIPDLGLKFRFSKVGTDTGKMDIQIWKRKDVEPPFIIVQAIVFPLINLLWLGCVLMAIGTVIAIWHRVKSA